MGFGPTQIEWIYPKPGFSANPITGKCPMECDDYCYGKRIRKRFKKSEKIEFHKKVLHQIYHKRNPVGIFMGSAFEIFAPSTPDEWINEIYRVACFCQQHTFYFLSKNPQKWACILPGIPDHIHFGVTVTAERDMWRLDYVKALNGFVSMEPLFEDLSIYDLKGLSWVIVGALTGLGAKLRQPRRAWIDRIREQCRDLRIPYFEKNNLKEIMGKELIQERLGYYDSSV